MTSQPRVSPANPTLLQISTTRPVLIVLPLLPATFSDVWGGVGAS